MPVATTVSQLIHGPLVTVGPGATVEDVESLARRKGVHHIPIVQRGHLLGIVCTCDLDGAAPGVRALQLARRNVVTAEPDSTASDAARLMIDNAVGSVVVSNRDGLWGIVTRGDLERANASLADSLDLRRCASCHSARHLRQGPGETLLCVACAERASAAHWYDEGNGD